MWFIILILFILCFVIEERIKHRFWQPVLFFTMMMIMALTFAYGPAWLENLM